MNIIVRAGILAKAGYAAFNAENAIPVENAEKAPQAIPNPGINIGNARNVL